MNIANLKTGLSQLKLQRNYSLCLNMFLGLMLFISLLVNLAASRDFKLTMIPGGLTESISITNSSVSNSYLEQWARYLAELKLNVTPETIDQSHKNLLEHVSSFSYYKINEAMLDEAKQIKESSVSTAFYIKEAKTIDAEKHKVLVTGQLKTYIGEELHKSEHVEYVITFSYRSGRLLMTSFEEKADA